MTFEWTGWEDDPATDVSPYVDWLKEVCFEGNDEKDGLSLTPLPLSEMAAKILDKTTSPAPLPDFARPGPEDTISPDPLVRLTWMPDQDCAIVGVIDSGIALSHARFRRLDGGTRFLSAWLQGGDWRDEAAVPFGRELFRTEIDQLMFRAMAAGTLDEGEFDRASGSSQFGAARGDRRLESNATHGTFVADLAAGYDLRLSQDDEFRRRLPMIAVGLPPNTSMGSSGNFLEFFALHAIEYIIDRADRIWRACDLPEGGAFPIIINLSYGLQAGPKDGHMLIEQVIRAINKEADKTGRPIRVILPAGNDLLSEGAAKFELTANASQQIDWRIQPEDQTPNYAELWSDLLDGDGGPPRKHPLGLSVAPPSGPASDPAPGKAGQCNTLKLDGKPVARIYCRKHEGGAGWQRVGYYVCTAPTQNEDRMSGAPSGAWTWTVSAASDAAGFGYVQSDQSLTFGSNTGLVSNFEHPDFHTYDLDTGRAIDACPFDPSEPADDTPPLRRKGTLNAIATLTEAPVIGSYRVSDGRPSIFSSAGALDFVGGGRKTPTCLLPGEEGTAHFGLMAAGSRSGSAALMAGTSFSTALATRAVSQAMLGWMDGGRKGEVPGSEQWFADHAGHDEGTQNWPGDTCPEKAGAGRMVGSQTGRQPRREVS